ncbi:trifunctional hydroxymethylpyrimidine kinase/phosphomethylpyrimidine kinase/thiaminase [Kickxella alabastrina]|uniref:Trifunctional hydroxymethylpyrimidine kinase/phosphomethylpyrimidine kinase/thiaminase n=1 Tax=Kickxella alabastrina TaxID=61397 RepID=A0ACC1IV00_9FUNG|nr:trifunctional hydroxymethylpyrimidine kinase/phosphomethylpyrimidine kinase/thiaminase [Kickxella alabastrina]
MTASTPPPAVLTIAGSDSGGGAGIQADLKTFMAHCTYGLSVITAITAQNTQEVRSVMPVPSPVVQQQLEAVLDDIPVRAAKTGMLADASVIRTVANIWRQHRDIPLVIDPVMVATSGHELLDAQALDTLREELLPLATVLTPNLCEAEAILERPVGSITSVEQMEVAARELSARFGIPVTIVKGGHLEDGGKAVIDVVYLADQDTCVRVTGPRINSESTHGTGCTLSAAIAANLATGMDHLAAAQHGIRYVNMAIQTAYRVGSGAHGPVNHAHTLHRSLFFSPTLHAPHPFTEYLKGRSSALWTRYVNHDFVRQAGTGSLRRDCFIHYLKQDYIYLKHYARAAALAAFKSDSLVDIGASADIVFGCVRESTLHLQLCAQWGITREQMENELESSTSVAYTRYIIDRGLCGDLLELLVAMYPCLLGYGEAAARQAADLESVSENNPYWPWICAYADDEFQSVVDKGRRVIEELVQREMPSGARLERLVKTFNDTAALEIQFWNSALEYRG